jgi:hypothetical protein
MNTESTSWAQTELGQSKLGDTRRVKRIVLLAEQRGASPNASISQACGDAAATKAAYRFYDNKDIDAREILASHYEVTKGRLAGEKVVLAVQDTTQLDYTDHPSTTGLGVLNDKSHYGLLMHTTLAVTPQRVPLGIIDQQVWARPPEEFGKKHTRKSRPISQKESQKWLRSLEVTARVQEQLPQTHIVSIGDREADIYDLFMVAESLHQDLLVRASWDRCVAHPEGHLWAYMESRPIAGSVTITVPRKDGKPARRANLTIRYSQVTLCPPKDRSKEGLKPITLWAVLAEEETPAVDVEAICWLLLTTVRTDTFRDALERVQWYTCRWLVELYHKVLKSGCRIEERQFDHVERIKRYLALDTIVAWRVLFLTMLGRESPNMPCTAIFEAHEWQALYCFIRRKKIPPAEPPSLKEATRWVAQLGGFLGRKADGDPGVTVIWLGIQRLNDIAEAWLLFHPLADSQCG